MSPSKQRRKGDDFNRLIVEYLNTHLVSGKFKKIPGSGAIGTHIHESLLLADASGEISGFPKKIKLECKKGYSNKKGSESKSLSLQKEWLDKIKKEADTDFSMPILVGGFDNVRSGSRAFVAIDLDIFIQLANHITKLQKELDTIYDKQKLGTDKKSNI